MNKKTKKICVIFLIIAICGVIISLFAYAFSYFSGKKIPLDDGSRTYFYEESVDNVYIKAENTVVRITKGTGECCISTKNIPRISYEIMQTPRRISYNFKNGAYDFLKTVFSLNKIDKYSGIYAYIPQKINYREKEIFINVSESRIVKFQLDLENCTVYFSDIDTLSDYIISGENNEIYFQNISGESYIFVDENKNSVYFG